MEHIENQQVKELSEACESNLRMASSCVNDALSCLECDSAFTQYAEELWQLHRKLIAFRSRLCFVFTPEKYFQR